MIPFDITKMTNEHVKVKYVTAALGGSMSILDEEATAKTGQETFKRIPVPLAIARKFIIQHEIARYIKPVLTSVTMYDGHVVALERHPLGNMGKESVEGLFGTVAWKSDSEKNLDDKLKSLTNDGEKWYIDGTLIYKFNEEAWKPLSSDGKFLSSPVTAIKMADIITEGVETIERACLTFAPSSGATYTSPPIWKSLSNIGNRQLSKVDEDDSADNLQFNRIDEFLAVNLGFALKASKELSGVFGYGVIEPLALDDLMIQLRTVNLPKVSKHVKRTFDTGMKFTHAMAWLVGLSSRTETLESYKVVRATLKFLTTKGVYPKTALQHNAIYHGDMDADSVPLMTTDEALASDNKTNNITSDNVTREVGSFGSLYGAE